MGGAEEGDRNCDGDISIAVVEVKPGMAMELVNAAADSLFGDIDSYNYDEMMTKESVVAC